MSNHQTSVFKTLLFIAFIALTCTLSGVIAINFNYPSLFNVDATFGEYAIPLPFNWALAHIPSLLIFGVPLFFLNKKALKYVNLYRIICGTTFLLTLLELDQKIPFVLFPKVDALLGLCASYILVPPTRQDAPKQRLALLSIAALISIATLYTSWQMFRHRTPSIHTSAYLNGQFQLQRIVVHNDFFQRLEFHVQVSSELPADKVCTNAQTLSSELLHDYPFDEKFEKLILFYSPNNPDRELGELSLMEEHREKDGSFPCFYRR